MLEAFWIGLQILALILLADFIGGLFHWAEDSYGTEHTPFWGPVFVRPNLVHHERPAEMMKIHWLRNNAINVSAGVAVVALFWVVGALSWQVVMFAVAVSCNQQAHRFAHTPTSRLPRVVAWLQRWHILQDARHHWRHHTAPHDGHYCVLTTVLNPVLDRTGFWRGLEWGLRPALGRPRGRG